MSKNSLPTFTVEQQAAIFESGKTIDVFDQAARTPQPWDIQESSDLGKGLEHMMSQRFLRLPPNLGDSLFLSSNNGEMSPARPTWQSMDPNIDAASYRELDLVRAGLAVFRNGTFQQNYFLSRIHQPGSPLHEGGVITAVEVKGNTASYLHILDAAGASALAKLIGQADELQPIQPPIAAL